MKQEHKYIIDPNIIAENKTITRAAYERGDYVLCFLLIHSLIEALLRAFLSQTGKESFNELIGLYKQYIKEQGQVRPTFVDELPSLTVVEIVSFITYGSMATEQPTKN